jgi:outer membrane usher protein
MTLTQNGKPLPFGATVTTDDKDSEFIVGNDGQTYLSGLPQHGKLSVPGDKVPASTASLNTR